MDVSMAVQQQIDILLLDAPRIGGLVNKSHPKILERYRVDNSLRQSKQIKRNASEKAKQSLRNLGFDASLGLETVSDRRKLRNWVARSRDYRIYYSCAFKLRRTAVSAPCDRFRYTRDVIV